MQRSSTNTLANDIHDHDCCRNAPFTAEGNLDVSYNQGWLHVENNRFLLTEGNNSIWCNTALHQDGGTLNRLLKSKTKVNN